MYNAIWGLYALLGASIIMSFIGMGILSLLTLLLTLFLAKKWCDISDEIKKTHFSWIVKSSQLAVFIHILLIAFFIYEASQLIDELNGDSFLTAIAAHWFIAHLIEVIIAVWLAYRTIKGVSHLASSKQLK